jgi:hypothetical protein
MQRITLAALVLFLAVGARAEATNVLSKAEVEGRELARQLTTAQPAENFTNSGVLKIRAAAGKREIPIKCTIAVTPTNWVSFYEIRNGWGTESLTVTHGSSGTNRYDYHLDFGDSVKNITLSGDETMRPFAGSDFWFCDLGLEFFNWPAQKVLKKEVKRSRGCTVLESINLRLTPNTYARVVSWIDNESGGIVQAEAYDFKNKLLKEFAPKSFKKVAGQWQLQEIEIRNVQTGSRTRLEFALGGE